MSKEATDEFPSKSEGRQVEQRWTPTLAKNGWTPIVDDFLRYYGRMSPEITAGEAMFIIQLMSFKWDSKRPRPGFKTVATRMGLSHTQVRNYARRLEKHKYLVRVSRTGTTNRYDLTPLFSAIERVAKQFERQRIEEEGDEE